MSTFQSSRENFNQEHFTIIEIDLPVVNGTCTISGDPGYGTPLSCDQPSNAVRTYKFTDYGGVLPESGIYKCIRSIREKSTSLKVGTGLAERGTITVSFGDFIGDPNPAAPAVDDNVVNQGTFFGKFDSRFIITNNLVRKKDYRVEQDGSIDLVNGARTSYFIANTFKPGKDSLWTLSLKDELSKTNFGESVWPPSLEGYLRNDITNSQTTFDVDPNINYQVGDIIRLGDELCKISSTSGIQTPAAQIGVNIRGNDIGLTNVLSKTRVDTHSAGDEIFLCVAADNERVDDLIKRIIESVGVDPSLIPISDWNNEIDEWNIPPVNTIFVESLDTSDVLNSLLIPRQLNQWYDPIDREIKLTAINAWKESTLSIEEGLSFNDNAVIDFDSVTKTMREDLRATRAVIVYNKPYLTDSDDVQYFKKASISKRLELETTDLFGTEPKWKQFDFSSNIDKNTADLLVSRYLQRNLNPYSLTWTTQEKKLSFAVGDVVDIKTANVVGFSGLPSTNARGQIIKAQPEYTIYGRQYRCEAFVYEPSLDTGTEIVISGNITDVNLYIQYAGAPSQPVELTFIFDGTVSSSTSSNTPSIRAGAFPAGSKLILILVNGADLQAKGGTGGTGGGLILGPKEIVLPSGEPTNGTDGATVFDAEGIDCDIYLSGATPSANYPISDGYIRAPGGGGGGLTANFFEAISGNGGGGGAGRQNNNGGTPGIALGVSAGNYGGSGDDIGNGGVAGGGSWGVDGSNNNALGGKKGKGIINSGGTVTLFGESPVRYINGGGDHP